MNMKYIRRATMALLAAFSMWSYTAKAQQTTEVDYDAQYATELVKPGTTSIRIKGWPLWACRSIQM